MVVVSDALDDRAAAEELPEELDRGSRRCGLRDRELVLDLPAERTGRVAHHRYREAALAVDEADDPLLETRPFLLIARTGRIVTVHANTLSRECDRTSTAGCSGVPAYSQLHSVPHGTEGQLPMARQTTSGFPGSP